MNSLHLFIEAGGELQLHLVFVHQLLLEVLSELPESILYFIDLDELLQFC